ncbi:MAG: thiamine-phosphate kinase [Bacteroidetes bacterium]|nr:MAG: thiamine-phosphate kinase [Bacteroidota bacterium]
MNERTELASLGEFGLIDRLAKPFEPALPETLRGIGDDCAVLDYGGESLTLISTDMLVEGVHFDLAYCPLKHLGYKAVAVNVSDIAAMNGTPLHITVSIALSNRFSVEAVEELYAGMQVACKDYKVDLVGGDTTTSRSGLVLSISVLGRVGKDKIAYRSGANVHDVLCVTGDLGGAYLGLQMLEREKQVFLSNPTVQPELSGKDYIIQRQLKPIARTDVVFDLQEAGVVPTSMIDISDGLASEVMHLCKNSKVGMVIFEEKIPVDETALATAQEFNLDITTCTLNGGEDYELLFTVRPQDFEKLRNSPHITPIGYCLPAEQGIFLHTLNGNHISLQAQGWNHF